METKSALRLTIDIQVTLNGVDPKLLKQKLRELAEHAYAEGLLTGDTAAEVDEIWTEVTITPEPLDQEEISEHLAQCIEDGRLKPEDIPEKMAEYGLMETPDFVAELRRQMEE